jgi:hypothetical protein
MIAIGTWIIRMVGHLSLSFTWEKKSMKVCKRHNPPIPIWRDGVKEGKNKKRKRNLLAKDEKQRHFFLPLIVSLQPMVSIYNHPPTKEESKECLQRWILGYMTLKSSFVVQVQCFMGALCIFSIFHGPILWGKGNHLALGLHNTRNYRVCSFKSSTNLNQIYFIIFQFRLWVFIFWSLCCRIFHLGCQL